MSIRSLTQEDPIGLAGGLNLYGFADGDPVNFGDPFGLCPKEKQDESGTCPGGLSVAEWDAVVNAVMERVKDIEVAGAILGRLDAGDIRGAQGGTRLESGQVLDYDAAAVTNWMTDVVYVNRFTSSGSSTFAFAPGDLAFAMTHEHKHVLQVSGITPLVRRAMLRAYGRNAAYRTRIEGEANAFACANVTGARAFSTLCK